MQAQPSIREPRTWLKVVLWGLIAAYTFILPDVIVVYRSIVEVFGQESAGKVPVLIVGVVGAAYVLAVLLSKKNLKNLLYLIPCGVIAILIIKLVANPNKHIHIPEYVLMAWLLHAVLSKDYKGKGLFMLIFIYASMLGVVDELEQGIHPARFYGWGDMIVNSASGLIGVFTILGLKKGFATGWEWTTQLKRYKGLLGLSLFGLSGAVIMCAYLFQVQAAEAFTGVYPTWLLSWNVLFLGMTPVGLFLSRGTLNKNAQIAASGTASSPLGEELTARLWILPLLVILFYMHALVMYVAISGVTFA